jgi:glycerol transport system substrate-binding protein
MKKLLLASAVAVAFNLSYMPAFAGMAEAEKWVGNEFLPSTLSKDEQMKEMEWFVNAA